MYEIKTQSLKSEDCKQASFRMGALSIISQNSLSSVYYFYKIQSKLKWRINNNRNLVSNDGLWVRVKVDGLKKIIWNSMIGEENKQMISLLIKLHIENS